MKKIIILGSLLISSGLLHAQFRTQPAQLGVQFSGISTRTENSFKGEAPDYFHAYDFTQRISWKAGITSRIPLSAHFFLAPEISLVSKGGMIDKTFIYEEFYVESPYVSTLQYKGKAKLTYLEMPLNIGYNRQAGAGEFFIAAGPTLSYGLTGRIPMTTTYTYPPIIPYETAPAEQEVEKFIIKAKYDGKKREEVTDEKIHYRAVEFGVNGIAGYQLSNGLVIRANINYGITDISPDNDLTTKTWYYGLGIGYNFKFY